MEYGDYNTRFFHASAITNKKPNFTGALRNDSDDLIMNTLEINEYLFKNFMEAFMSIYLHPDEDLEALFQPCIS